MDNFNVIQRDGSELLTAEQLDTMTMNSQLSPEFLHEHRFELNWKLVCQYQVLDSEFINKYKNLINWPILLQYQKLSFDCIEENFNLIDWLNALDYQQLPEWVLQEISDVSFHLREILKTKSIIRLDLANYWYTFVRYGKLFYIDYDEKDTFVGSYIDLICRNEALLINRCDIILEKIATHQTLSKKFLGDNFKHFDRNILVTHQQLPDNMLIEYLRGYKFVGKISRYQKLSTKFLEEMFRFLDGQLIIQYQALSPELMSKYHFCLNWKLISRYQKLDAEFILEHCNRLDWKIVSQYQKLNQELIKKLYRFVDWPLVIEFQELTPEFKKEMENDFILHKV